MVITSNTFQYVFWERSHVAGMHKNLNKKQIVTKKAY